jgi:hypothetical protein
MRGNGTGGFYSDSHACVDCANRNMPHFKDLEPWPTLRLCRVGTVLAGAQVRFPPVAVMTAPLNSALSPRSQRR